MVAFGFADMFYAFLYSVTDNLYDFDIDDNYINCMVWNILNAYSFSIPWFTFLGEYQFHKRDSTDLEKNNYLLRPFLEKTYCVIIDYWLVPQRFIAGLNLDRLYAIKNPIGYFQLAK